MKSEISLTHYSSMTYPRAHLVDQKNGGYYHCISRCVRQSWLCGTDHQNGKSYEHRRGWIASRIQLLTNLFAVDVYAYAIMSNHYHIVVRLDPKRTNKWTDKDIVDRWLARSGTKKSKRYLREQSKRLLEQPNKINQIRSRLGSLSWFMRFINEPIARSANAEDECAGRFWEGRFKSVALLDRTALLACMVYVDLNPARTSSRAKIPSLHTSAHQRARNSKKKLANFEDIDTTLREYVDLLRWTRIQNQKAEDQTATSKPNLLDSINQDSQNWLQWVSSFSYWYRAYGLRRALDNYTLKLGQCWLQTPELRKMDLGNRPGFGRATASA